MTDSLVSIIVPVYNVEAYISECIESIQKQTYKKLQIILVDDGSTDRSGILCDEYAKKDRRIKVIHQPNGGAVVARERGLEAAEGIYIGFVDGDDNIASDMYQSLVEELETSGADFVHSGYWVNGKKKAANTKGYIDVSQMSEKIKLLETAVLGVDGYISPSIWSKLFRANVIKKSYIQISPNNRLGEDLINLCICILESSKVALIDKAYYHYRVRDDSLSHKKTSSRIKDTFGMYQGICEVLKSYDCYQELENFMDSFLRYRILEDVDEISYCFQVEKYFFQDINILEGKRIIVYGAGRVGRDYYAQICRYTECKVVAWVDSHSERYDYPHIKLHDIADLDSIEFDILVIAVKDAEVADAIYNQLVLRGIEENKIYWSNPERFLPSVKTTNKSM